MKTAFQFALSGSYPEIGLALERILLETLEKLATERDAEVIHHEDLGTYLITSDARDVIEAMDRVEEVTSRFLGRIGEEGVHLSVHVPGATVGLELFGEARRREAPVNLVDILRL
ncbi:MULTISPECIES: hypothetical protein [Bacteria]|uniref:hypothetical protein n=1 Tax=Pseudomonadati TaxID=3379134 RepID=UPI000223D0E5|nr:MULTISPECIES: hypothetical protein [Bacteria]AEN74735.1 hypothetical protein Rhom172_2855 [Rhodothermus marinus SG0.5JP17-172]